MEITLAEFERAIRKAGYANIHIKKDSANNLQFSLKRLSEDGDGETVECEVATAYGLGRLSEAIGSDYITKLAGAVNDQT